MIMLKTFFTSNTYSIHPTISTFANSSDQGLHCLPTDRSVKMKKKNTNQQLLKFKWIGPINKNGKFYLVHMG